jgi:hypothetical protein
VKHGIRHSGIPDFRGSADPLPEGPNPDVSNPPCSPFPGKEKIFQKDTRHS